ncbi:MAG: DUF4956 domain-containing protein [Treponema sp.]|nr:DUF4956 domain-containing protein [Treponema sp.]
MCKKSRNIGWGLLLLVSAGLVVASQFVTVFEDISIIRLVVVGLALAFAIYSLIRLNFASIPIPIAVLYFALGETLGLPSIPVWVLILSAVLASAGLGALFPPRFFKHRMNKVSEKTGKDGNPSLNVTFGAAHHCLSSNALEVVHIHCNFGAMKVNLDQAELKDGAARICVDCNFGAVKLVVPGHWQIDNQIECSLGDVDMGKNQGDPAEGAPMLTLTGSVSLGGLEVKRH